MKNNRKNNSDEHENRSSEHVKKPKKQHPPATPLATPALSLLLALVCFSVSLIATVINTFIYPFGDDLLAPLLLQILAILFPTYLALLLAADGGPPVNKLREIGFSCFKVKYIFFTIFSALFLICVSTALTVIFGGAVSLSEGVRLLGTFTAGENDFSVSSPYIILVYALIPAICEELLFRGMIFSQLKKISLPFAIVLSVSLSALFSFDLFGLIPAIFTGAFLTFVLYTTGSILPCIVVHFALNFYNLYLGSNIAAYSLIGQNSFLLFIVISGALLISAMLFFAEASKIYRVKAKELKKAISHQSRDIGEPSHQRQERLLDGEKWKELLQALRSTLAYTQNLIFLSVIAAVFSAVVIINLLT